MPASPTEYLTTECPNGHRVRGDVGWLHCSVRCPHCDAEFIFQRPGGTAAEVVATDGSKMSRRRSVSDTGVMRILGDFSSTAVQDDGTTRHCHDCGATYPSYVPYCFNCNVQLSEPVGPSPDEPDAASGIVFQDISSFPFADVAVQSVMRPCQEIDFLDLNTPLEKILNRVKSTAHTRYPVCDGSIDKLVGLVHIEDIVLADESGFSIKKLIRPLELLPETTPVSETLHHLQESGEGIAMVVDQQQAVVGLVTVKDVMLRTVRK